jgi:gliding motility-associated-like protein
VTFTATPVNGGAAPTYQWQINGTIVPGATNAIFTSTSLGDGSVVSVIMTSNDPCANPATATSSPISISVKQPTNSTTRITVCNEELPFTWNGNIYTAGGTYSVQLINAAGCDSLATLELTVSPSLPGVRYNTVVTQPNTAVQLTARDLGANTTYEWNPKFGLNDYTGSSATFNYDRDIEFTITLTPPNGCSVTDTVLVRILRDIPPDASAIYVPSAWSPNGDGHNDKLYPIPVNIRELKFFRVFNRWGQLVFETSVLLEGWNGIFKGQPQVSDVYTWTLEATGNDGKFYRQSGNAVLLR